MKMIAPELFIRSGPRGSKAIAQGISPPMSVNLRNRRAR